MNIGIPKESAPNERRVALVPDSLSKIQQAHVIVQAGAGEGAGFSDLAYVSKGAEIASDAKALYSTADLILKVQPPTKEEVSMFRENSTLIFFLYPLNNLETVRELIRLKVTTFAMDLMPRISRAQSMDALSSQATISGYKAVLLAANSLPKFFPMLMT